jgi:hypothetical protein
MNKENIKKIFGMIILLMIFLNINLVSADEQNIGSAISSLEGVFNGIGKLTETLFGGPPWLQGLATGLYSAYSTYNSLGENVKAEVERDSVNISANKDDYAKVNKDYKDDYCNDLNINFNQNENTSNIALTDKNVLDLTYLKTQPISYYIDVGNNPDVRAAEQTEEGFLIEGDAQKSIQIRSILFDDSKESIKDNYEFRNFLIRYRKINYKEDPVKVVVDLGDFWDFLGGDYLFNASDSINLFNEVSKKMDSDIENQREPYEITQRFRLLFNSRTEDESIISFDQLDCTSEDGSILGTTGSEYLPNVLLDWDFDSENVNKINDPETFLSKEHWCDSDKNGVYCDATQFSIEILHKVNKINDFVNNNKNSFSCPPPYIKNTLVSNKNNIGLTYLKAEFSQESSSNKKINLDFSIGGNYEITDIPELEDLSPDDLDTLLKFQILVESKASNSFEWVELYNEIEDLDVKRYYLLSGTPTEFSKTINAGQVQENYEIRVTVKLVEFDLIIKELETGDNANDNMLSLKFLSDTSSGCNLDRTSINLKDFVAGNNNLLNELDNLIEFKSYLMLDGYSSDFQKDFDDLYRYEFIDTPSFYKEENQSLTNYTPLYKYFKDISLFNFSLKNFDSSANLVLPTPGRYEVEIHITYDSYWGLFNDIGEPTGKIEIILNKDMLPEQDMPLYYMPLDGKVGMIDKTRLGYGVSYLGDSVFIKKPTSTSANNLKTEGYTSSNAIKTIQIEEVKDFDIMNNIERGKLLSITSDNSHNNNNIKFIPSRATPVALRVDNATGDAFAFYKLSIGAPEGEGGQIAHPGYTMTYWTGYNGCEDFTGISLIEAYLNRPDIVATESELAPITQSQNFVYGVEWPKDEITRTGSVWLKTIFYTPTNYNTGSGISKLYLDSRNDDAEFFVINNSGSSVELNSINNNNNFYPEKIVSLREIYDMIKNKVACVNYDSTYFDVYYNSKKIYEELDPLLENKIYSENNACIGATPPED